MTVKEDKIEITPIARIESDFGSKFGIPRQAGLVESLEARIVFEPEFRSEEALRGIENYSHIWLIWQFSENADKGWKPTVRPPRLGGNARMGVFATRSPFRPNSLGLSCVRLSGIEKTETKGTVLKVAGADLMNGTPIFDIKPYIPYSDCFPEAECGFAVRPEPTLEVTADDEILQRIPPEKREALREVLANDPRPAYQREAGRVYGLRFAGHDVRFSVEDRTLTVLEIQ